MTKKKINRIWSSKKADTEFSKFIRNRDKKCVKCGRAESLQCSHFWSRNNSATRYLPENADTLCYACHYGNCWGWEYQKQGAYMKFKEKQLGIDGYKALEKIANSTVKRKDSILQLMYLLNAY